LVEKSGKSASHVYARLSLLQLIPTVAETFAQERITASHANLIARLPQDNQAAAFQQCWPKDWRTKSRIFATGQACCHVDTGQPL
jgi:ParB family chromosome partitioning protein